MADAISEEAAFQSLFSWNLPSDSMREMTTPVKVEFQSLFSWNLPSDSIGGRSVGETPEKFQSLFSWNLPSDQL